jgi:hypothetical protein
MSRTESAAARVLSIPSHLYDFLRHLSVRWAAPKMLRTISFVAAVCSSTAALIEVATSFTSLITPRSS